MNNWGEFVHVSMDFLKARDELADIDIRTGDLIYSYVWTANGKPYEDCLDEAGGLICDAIDFTFQPLAHGHGESYLQHEIDGIGAGDVFGDWIDELRLIGQGIRADVMPIAVSFLTLWHCSAGKSWGPDGDDYWSEWELEGVIEPTATGVVFKPLRDFVKQDHV